MVVPMGQSCLATAPPISSQFTRNVQESRGMIKRILVLGGGAAGFLAAIGLKVAAPHLEVTVLRSKQIGIIGVGEGSTLHLPNYLHGNLKIPPGDFLRQTRATFKLGLRFIWGPRPSFHYPFRPQLAGKFTALNLP